MSTSSSAIDRTARALRQLRPDFTLTNARTFAQQVASAPPGVFGDKPLAYLPGPAAPTPSSHTLRRADDSEAGSGKRVFYPPNGPVPPVDVAVAASIAEAVAKYQDGFAWRLGKDKKGHEVRLPVTTDPHLLIDGGTGHGVTVTLLGIIEQARASGWAVFAASAPRSTFAPGLEEAPNVVAVGRTFGEYRATIEAVHREMTARAQGSAGFGSAPILLALSDASTATSASAAASERDIETERLLDEILAEGEVHRIHVAITPFGAGRWGLSRPVTTISCRLGAEGFTALVRRPGDGDEVECARYWWWSPCLTRPSSDEAITNAHDRYRRDVAARIPRLHGPDTGLVVSMALERITQSPLPEGAAKDLARIIGEGGRVAAARSHHGLESGPVPGPLVISGPDPTHYDCAAALLAESFHDVGVLLGSEVRKIGRDDLPSSGSLSYGEQQTAQALEAMLAEATRVTVLLDVEVLLAGGEPVATVLAEKSVWAPESPLVILAGTAESIEKLDKKVVLPSSANWITFGAPSPAELADRVAELAARRGFPLAPAAVEECVAALAAVPEAEREERGYAQLSSDVVVAALGAQYSRLTEMSSEGADLSVEELHAMTGPDLREAVDVLFGTTR